MKMGKMLLYKKSNKKMLPNRNNNKNKPQSLKMISIYRMMKITRI